MNLNSPVTAELTAFEHQIQTHEMMAYGAATWDWYACHYNDDAAKALGLPAPFVDGQMWGAWFARAVRAHCGQHAFVRAMQLRYHALCFAGDTLRGTGHVTETREEGDLLVLEIAQRIEKGEARVASCTTTVAVPKRPATEQGDRA